MAMTVTEANAVFTILDWLAGPKRLRHRPVVSDESAVEAINVLGQAAGKRLQVSFVGERAAGIHDAITGRLAACDSDGDAQAVCRALAEHESHGGKIPWPAIAKPYEAWKTARA